MEEFLNLPMAILGFAWLAFLVADFVWGLTPAQVIGPKHQIFYLNLDCTNFNAIIGWLVFPAEF